jgi:acyl-coenzyme A synthetase/AMP-(fatty) acid ligase
MQFGASESVQHWGKYRPASPAVIHNGQVATYGQLNVAVDALCREILRVQGSKRIPWFGKLFGLDSSKTQRIAVAVRSRLRLLISIIAVLRTGRSVVLLNSELDDDPLRVNLREAKVSFLIHDNENQRIAKLMESSAKNRTLNIDLLTKDAQTTSNSFIPREPEDEWGVLFSSGTTGIPKGIERSQESMVTEFVGWCLELGLNRQTRFYLGRPIYYTGGLVLTFSTLLVGGQLIINDYVDHTDPKEVWIDFQKTLSSRTVNWAFFVPSQIRVFCELVTAGNLDPLKADSILVMGAPITGEEKIRAASLLSSDIIESWGNSESLGTITDAEDIEKRPNSIGRPFVTDELYIVDDSLIRLGPKQEGRIAGNEEAGFLRYCNRPDDTSRAKQKKLIVSEDIGYTDNDGFFYVLGRQQDRIVVGDETLFLPEIDNQLRKHPLVKDCCVRPQDPDAVNVELVGVIVVSQPLEASQEKFLQELNATLSGSQRLAAILILDEMPSLQAGKIDKLKVAALLKERL